MLKCLAGESKICYREREGEEEIIDLCSVLHKTILRQDSFHFVYIVKVSMQFTIVTAIKHLREFARFITIADLNVFDSC